MSSYQLNSKNNGLVLLLKTILQHGNCFLSSVATDGKDGNGLKLEKIIIRGRVFQVLLLMLCLYKSPLLDKIHWISGPRSFPEAFFIWAKE